MQHYVVPVYAADVAAGWVPNRAAMAHKPESEWPVVDETYEFLFSLHPGDYFRVWEKEGEPGPLLYMTSFDRSSVNISGNTHDRSNRKPDGAINPVRVSVKNAHRIEKIELGLLGDISTVKRPGKRPS
jgi:CRISPR-associated endonuclease Csn1